MDTLHLNKEELETALWKKIEKHFKGQLTELRALNDWDRTEGETAHLRGRIAQCKEVLLLDPGNGDV